MSTFSYLTGFHGQSIDKSKPYESVEVVDRDGVLEGYALVKDEAYVPWEMGMEDPRILTPVRATRSSAWADLDDLVAGKFASTS